MYVTYVNGEFHVVFKSTQEHSNADNNNWHIDKIHT